MDDGDGDVDCDDSDCASAQNCQIAGTENCSNGVDDDGDGLDCNDSDCLTTLLSNVIYRNGLCEWFG